jgi:hypothetical protein
VGIIWPFWNLSVSGLEPAERGLDRRMMAAELEASDLVCPTLGDKASAGGTSNGCILVRPVKRIELGWRRDAEHCRTVNRLLSAKLVRVEPVFAHLTAFRLIRNQFSLRRDRYAMIFRAVSLIDTVSLETKDQEQVASRLTENSPA